jgi:MFS family permease
VTRSPGTYASALASRPFRAALIAYALASLAQGTWAVALTVALFQQTGSGGWAAAGAASRLLPYLLVSPVAGVLADRWGHRRTLYVTGVVRIALAAVLTAGVAVEAPPLLLVALAVAATAAGTPVYPTLAAFVPSAVPTQDLAAASSLLTAVETGAWVLGPALGGALVAAVSPALAILAATTLLLLSQVALLRIPRVPRSVSNDEAPAPSPRIREELADGIRTVVASATTATVVGMVVVVNLIDGAGQVLLVLAADERLGMGDGGFGALTAALGVGALGAITVNRRMASGPSPLLPLVTAAVVMGLTFAAIGVVTSAAPALALLVLCGGASVVADVVAITVLQRTVPVRRLACVFGLLDAGLVGAMLLGTIVAPALDRALGVADALIVTGGALPVLAFATAPFLRRAGQASALRAATLRPTVDLLGALPLLRHAPEPVLEALALAARPATAPAGTTILREGDPPDDVYVLVRGECRVLRGLDADEHEVARTGPGECFGEVGPLAGQARNASVVAVVDSEVLRIPGATFVAAVTGSAIGSAGSAAAGIVTRVATPVPSE